MTQEQVLTSVTPLDYSTRLVIVPRLEDWLDADGNWMPDLAYDLMSYADTDTETKEWNRMVLRTKFQESVVRNASRFTAFREVIKRKGWPYSLWHNYPGLGITEPVVRIGSGLNVELNIFGQTFNRMVQHATSLAYIDSDPRRAMLSDFFSSQDLTVIRPGDGLQVTDYFEQGLISTGGRSLSDPDHVVILHVVRGQIVPTTYQIPLRD